MSAPDEWVDEPEPLHDDDFLAFWRAEQAKVSPTTKRILGVDVLVPQDLPLRLEAMASQMQATQDPAELKALLAELFGGDHLDTWITNGLTTRMMQVIIAWGVSNGTGTPCTFERALELATALEVANAGKAPDAPNRAARRASSRTAASASTGRSSSRTSAASTASRPTRSRA